MMTEKQKLEMEITEKLIESKLSIREQISVIVIIETKLKFCKATGEKMKQTKLKL